ncbi:group II intron maturase-specific domain-containing protein [Paraburkholderia sp. JHI2823]|uniref:group II intron maturase-specific domain-containing protein n=1 Tax=Paraburkholderia sp. JHI2823 TaxID=3112960 RepID=UPI00318021AF
MIRGWAQYHRHVVSKVIFSSIDSHIWRWLWKWAKRRHPMKGARWVRQRYFRRDGYRFWDFATKGSTEGDTCGLQLFRAATVVIQRHVKIRGGWPIRLIRHGIPTLAAVEPRNAPPSCPVPPMVLKQWLEPDAG